MGSEVWFGLFFGWVFASIAVYKDWLDTYVSSFAISRFHKAAVFSFVLFFWWGVFIM